MPSTSAPRSSSARKLLEERGKASTGTEGTYTIRLPILRCGHRAQGEPPLSNPRRWWCCDGWQAGR